SLYKEHLLAKQDYDLKKFTWEAQQATVKQSEMRLVQARAQREQSLAQLASAQKRIAQYKAVLVRFNDILQKHNAFAPLDGVVASQSAISSQEAKDFKVVVALDNPPDEIRPGLSCTAKITTATRKNVLTIPIQALTVRQKGQLEPKPADGKVAPVAAKLDPVVEKAKKEELQGVFL